MPTFQAHASFTVSNASSSNSNYQQIQNVINKLNVDENPQPLHAPIAASVAVTSHVLPPPTHELPTYAESQSCRNLLVLQPPGPSPRVDQVDPYDFVSSSLSNSLTPPPRPYLDPIPAQQTDRRGPLTSTPLRPLPCQPHAQPTDTSLTPVTRSPEVFSPIGTGTTVAKIDRGLSLNDEQSKNMQKWADSRSYIEHLTKVDATPPKEDCLLVFQCLIIMWCYINSYPSRLLKRFTVYDFVNIVDKNNEDKEFVVSVLDGNKYKYRTALKFNKFEKQVMTFYFKRIRPLWISGLKLLNDSFSTCIDTISNNKIQEITQIFFYNSNGNKQLNVARICENFQAKMTAPHKKSKPKASLDDKLGPSSSSAQVPDPINKISSQQTPLEVALVTSDVLENNENVDPEPRRKRLSHHELMLISPISKKRLFYSTDNQSMSASFNAVKKFFQTPKNVDETIPTPAECCNIICKNTNIDSSLAKTLGERVNDHLRYKLVNLRVQKSLNFFTGAIRPSTDDIAKFARNRGSSDVARIVDKTFASWKPAPASDTRRSTRNTPLEEPAAALPSRGVNIFFCKSTSTICNTPKVSEYLSSQQWPFLQVCERIVFSNGTFGRGVVTTAKICESEIVCDYHTDVIVTQSVLFQRENTQYMMDCGDIVFDATLDTCACHPGRRTFGRLLNYRPSNHPECNVRARRVSINGKHVILFIAKRPIEILEELCFDYNDPKCRTEFGPAAYVRSAGVTPQTSTVSRSVFSRFETPESLTPEQPVQSTAQSDPQTHSSTTGTDPSSQTNYLSILPASEL